MNRKFLSVLERSVSSMSVQDIDDDQLYHEKTPKTLRKARKKRANLRAAKKKKAIRMQKIRENENFRSREKAKDQDCKRSCRSIKTIGQKEQDLNTQRRRLKRSQVPVRKKEQAADTQRRKIIRKDASV